MAGNILQKYGTSNQSITCTFTSLTNNSVRGSAAVDNTSNTFMDALVFVKVKSGASGTSGSGTSGSGTVNVYACGTADGGTNYTDGVGGTDAAVTLTSPPNARLIGVINVVVNSTTYYGGPFSVANAFGGVLPGGLHRKQIRRHARWNHCGGLVSGRRGAVQLKTHNAKILDG